MDGFLKKVKRWLHKVSGTPVLGSMAEDLMTLIDLLTDYRAGIYRDLPKGVFIAAAMGLGYALFPVDLILDIIPFAGFLDDAAILMLLLDFFIARDILRYRNWKTGLQSRGLYALRESCTADVLALMGEKHLAAAFLTEKQQLRLLLSRPGDARRPLPCRSLVTGIPSEQLTALGAQDWEAIGQFYTEVFRDPRIPWSQLGPRPFMPEYDPQASTSDFLIEQ
jgi:uncharacterized membrane protein YkvA (DUF1232 family)